MTLEPLGFPGPQQHGLSHAKQQELLRKVRKPLTVDKRTMWMRETSGGIVIGARPTGKGGINCRWFRVMTDDQVVAMPNNEELDNDLTCRTHDCEGVQFPDDAPSVWGIWEDVEDCEWYVVEQDPTPTLVYFPQYRTLCSQGIPPTPEDKCRGGVTDPECRKNRHVFACFNTIGQRWEAVNDVEDCLMEEDVAHIVICDRDAITTSAPHNAPQNCCVYDAIKVEIYPTGEGLDATYCVPEKDRTRVWARCSNGNLQVLSGHCELGVKICDAFECTWVPDPLIGEVTEERPVYLIDCGDCTVCQCPAMDVVETPGANVVDFRITVRDPLGPCGFIHNFTGTMHCLDENPFTGALDEGWYAHFQIAGVTPRLLYHATPWDQTLYPDGVWLEIACGGETAPAGTIIAAFTEDPLPPHAMTQVGVPVDTGAAPPAAPNPIYEIGIDDCTPYVVDEVPQTRARNYNYGLWLRCEPVNFLFDYTIYLLKDNFATVPDTSACNGGVQTFQRVSGPSEIIGGPEPLQSVGGCCDNFQVACLAPGLQFGCGGAAPVPIIGMEGGIAGTTECTFCNHPGSGHTFAGCPCNWILNGLAEPCTIGPNACPTDPWPDITEHTCCEHPGNNICFEFQWPEVTIPA